MRTNALAYQSTTLKLNISLRQHHSRANIQYITHRICPQIKAIGQAELNTSNPEEVLQLAAQKRKKRFLQAMAKLYF